MRYRYAPVFALRRGIYLPCKVCRGAKFLRKGMVLHVAFEARTRQLRDGYVYGPLVPKIIRYSLPLMLTGILQLLYNAADIIVVGRFVGDTALAAVSSTGSLINPDCERVYGPVCGAQA